MIKSKKAQEEMVGFGLIIVIAAVVILIFLSFMLRKPNTGVENSFEAESFMQAMLQYTTNCNDNQGFVNIQNLIFDCSENQICEDERSSCEVLNKSMGDILSNSWKLENRPEKGYSFGIKSEIGTLCYLEEGNKTENYKISTQMFSKGGNAFNISFYVYY